MKPMMMMLMVAVIGCGLASYMTSRLLDERNANQTEEAKVKVLVAKTKVPAWVLLKEPEKYFEEKEVPESIAPKKGLKELCKIKDQRLSVALSEGEYVLEDKLVNPEQVGLIAKLPPGMRAIALKVNAESLAGGFVLPGYRVDVLSTPRGGGNESVAKIILQDMLVLAVDTIADRDNQPTSMLGSTVTLAMMPEEAQRLSLAAARGELRLTLRTPDDDKIARLPGSKGDDLGKPIHGSQGKPNDVQRPPLKSEVASAESPAVTPLLVLLGVSGFAFIGMIHRARVEKRREEEYLETARREADRRENANFHQGQEALRQGDFDLALSCADEEIRRDPECIRGHRMRGQALYSKGMYKQAIEDYCRAIRLEPKEGNLYRLRADCFAALGSYTQAIADYSDAIRLNPSDTTALEHRKAAYTERETRGDFPSIDCPGASALITELPPQRTEEASANRDRDPSFQPIQRTPATTLLSPPKVVNPLALTGFILGLTSIVFYFIGIIPILGIVFSAIGLGRFNPQTHKGKWMAGWGLALSILFTLMYLARR